MIGKCRWEAASFYLKNIRFVSLFVSVFRLHVCTGAFIDCVDVIPEGSGVPVILNGSWLCSAWGWKQTPTGDRLVGTSSWKTVRIHSEVPELRTWIKEWPLTGGEHLKGHRKVPRRKPTRASITGTPLAACPYCLQQTGLLSPLVKLQAVSHSAVWIWRTG